MKVRLGRLSVEIVDDLPSEKTMKYLALGASIMGSAILLPEYVATKDSNLLLLAAFGVYCGTEIALGLRRNEFMPISGKACEEFAKIYYNVKKYF